jgi:hypothetical protein
MKLFADDIDFATHGAFEGDVVAFPVFFWSEV